MSVAELDEVTKAWPPVSRAVRVPHTEADYREPDFTILHVYQIKSVRESSRNDEASILVAKPGRLPGKFEDESVLFSSISERLSDEYVEVYAPVSWVDHAERTRNLNAVTPIVKEIISTNVRSIQLTMKL